jgi:hypothetical protein
MRKPRFAQFDDAVRAWFEAGGATPLAIRAGRAELRAFLLWHAGHFGGVSPSDYEEIPVGPLAARDRHAVVVGGKTADGEPFHWPPGASGIE